LICFVKSSSPHHQLQVSLISIQPYIRINSPSRRSHNRIFINAIKRAPPDKAPGEDGIPNRVWNILADNNHDFVAIMTAIFDACIRTGHNPRHFQASITVTLRKGGPCNFRQPKSYQPVALLNTLGKILESIIATRIA
jgi:hypothetical protein